MYGAGCRVTIDALGGQTAIAQPLIERPADDGRALKGNQGHVYEQGPAWFAWANQSNFAERRSSSAQMVNKGHGRLESRRCYAWSDPRAVEVIRHQAGWAGVQALVRVARARPAEGEVQPETAVFLSRLPAHAQRLLHAVRPQWSVEKTVHWSLDVTFRDAEPRLRPGHSAETFAVLRPIAFNLLKRQPANRALKRQRAKAARDAPFFFDLISQV